MSEHPTSDQRGNVETGQILINLALAMMRDVKDSLQNFGEKLDTISTERREEAKMFGKYEQQIQQLDQCYRDHLEQERTNRRLVIGAVLVSALSGVGVLLLWILRVISQHPEVVR